MSNDVPACKDCARVQQPFAKSTPGHRDKTKKYPQFKLKEVIIFFVLAVIASLILFGPLLIDVIINFEYSGDVPRPNFFIRLVAIEGFDAHASVLVPPTFHLAVDVEGIAPNYNVCSGGGKSIVRVSYHGMILAWGNVPRFCMDGNLIQQRVDNVVTMETKAEGAVLREEIRSLVWSEQQAIGKAEFDLEGEVSGLGNLSCKVFYSSGKSTDSKALCMVQ